MLLNQGFGSFHLFLTVGTQFRVDGPGTQDQSAPLDPFARFELFGQLLGLALLFRIQVAQGVGEVASIGNLVLAGARDVLHPLCEEVIGVLPNLGDGPGRREPDLSGCLYVGQMLQRQGRMETYGSQVRLKVSARCSSALAAGEVGRLAG